MKRCTDICCLNGPPFRGPGGYSDPVPSGGGEAMKSEKARRPSQKLRFWFHKVMTGFDLSRRPPFMAIGDHIAQLAGAHFLLTMGAQR
jgi:hypothetical protein